MTTTKNTPATRRRMRSRVAQKLLTQAQLANLGISQNYLSELEHGQGSHHLADILQAQRANRYFYPPLQRVVSSKRLGSLWRLTL